MLKLLCFLIPLSTANVTSASDLVSAAKNKSIVEVEACLAKGAQIDSVDEIGETALHHACHKGSPDIVELLLREVTLFSTTPIFPTEAYRSRS